jgi:hypothetical protein
MNLESDPTNEIFIKYDNILKIFKKYFNEKVFYIKYGRPDYIKIPPSEKQQYIFIYYKYPGFNESELHSSAVCLMITLFEFKTIILNLFKFPEPNICKISGVELLCLLYTVAKELNANGFNFNILIPEDKSSKSYTLKGKPHEKDEIYLTDYYILLKGVSWYGQYGYYSENHHAELIDNEKVRNLSISEYFNNSFNRENDINWENDVNNIIDYINKLNGPQITYETPIKDVMNILDNIKRNEEKKGILYLNDKVIKYIMLIIEQDLIHYDNKDLLLDINNLEIDNIYNNLCSKLTITINTGINTGGKKYMRRKKTIRKKLKKQKKKYTYKNKKMKYKFRI